MVDTAHTPGPWTFSENAYGAVFVHGGKTLTSSVGTEYKELIAGGNSHNTLTLVNARLIAAAPDLLETLEWVRSNYASGPTSEINARIDAAISKATA